MGKCFEMADVFPLIRSTIFQIYDEKRARNDERLRSRRPMSVPLETDWVLHDDIVDRLLTSEPGKSAVRAAQMRCDSPAEWLASQFVQWWSQRCTLSKSNPKFAERWNQWAEGIERIAESDKAGFGGNWAYRPVSQHN
jgi:hypothetical protein